MKINTLLGIEYPIIQGGMAHIATAEFAASVSNAGGLGLIGGGSMDAEMLRTEIQKCKSLTTNPFGVNVMLLNPDADAIAQMLTEEKVPVITTGAGSPVKYMEMWKAVGSKVIPVVPSVALAKRVVKAGADAVVAEGTEAGGHIGELTTMALIPQVAAAVEVPVIAAGGIASGAQMLAAFALGASGVQMGTALLVSEECPIHESYKEAVLKAKDISTVVMGRSIGVPVRVIRNQMVREYSEQEKQGASWEELEVFTLGSLRRAVIEGDEKHGSLMAGQVAGQLTEIRPLRTIFETLQREYNERLSELNKE